MVEKWHGGMDTFSFGRLLHRCYCGNWNHLIRQPCCVISFSACSFFYFSVLIPSLPPPFPGNKSLQNLSPHTCGFLSAAFILVCVGGRGGGSLHASGEAADPAALQACGESRQERFPVPQEALPQRNRVSTALTAVLGMISDLLLLADQSISHRRPLLRLLATQVIKQYSNQAPKK